jgi:hypothetical protein
MKLCDNLGSIDSLLEEEKKKKNYDTGHGTT